MDSRGAGCCCPDFHFIGISSCEEQIEAIRLEPSTKREAGSGASLVCTLRSRLVAVEPANQGLAELVFGTYWGRSVDSDQVLIG